MISSCFPVIVDDLIYLHLFCKSGCHMVFLPWWWCSCGTQFPSQKSQCLFPWHKPVRQSAMAGLSLPSVWRLCSSAVQDHCLSCNAVYLQWPKLLCQELTENKDDFQESNLLSKILCCSEVWPFKHTLFVPTLQPNVIPFSALVAHALQFHKFYFAFYFIFQSAFKDPSLIFWWQAMHFLVDVLLHVFITRVVKRWHSRNQSFWLWYTLVFSL